jgi:hypothetical protein
VRFVRLKTPPRVSTGVAYRPEAYTELVPELVATLRACFQTRRPRTGGVRRLGTDPVTAR